MEQISDAELSELDESEEGINTYPRESSIFRPERSCARPIMLLFSGSARCVNKYFPGVSFVAKRLATGSMIGESDAIQSLGIDFFGDIYAEKNGL